MLLSAAALLLACAPAFAAPSAPEDALSARGRALLGELNCTACHKPSDNQLSWISPKTAPRLAELGARANPEWVRQYLLAPEATLPGTTMPDALHGLDAAGRKAAAEDLTHYLFSVSPPRWKPAPPDKSAAARGEKLFHQIGCVACHAPQLPGSNDTNSVPLPRMSEKWTIEGLRRFLLDPLATRPSGRMPGMGLTDREASDLAHYLLRETKIFSPLRVAVFRDGPRSLNDLDQLESVSDTPAQSFVLQPPGGDDWRALRFGGWLEVGRAGDYTFYIEADGAARLSLDGQWIEDEGAWEHDATKATGELRLSEGWHQLQVDFARRGRKPPALRVEWECRGVPREPIPPSSLRANRDIGPAPEPAPFVVDASKAARGRGLFKQLNCAVCHEGNSPANPPPALTMLHETDGCLAEKPPARATDYHLAAPRIESLKAALANLSRHDLAKPSPRQRLAQAMTAFRCTACHSREGAGGVAPDRDSFFGSNAADMGEEGRLPPRLDGVGDKLQPAWLTNVLAKGARVRPYLKTRMPQFGDANVTVLAEWLIALDRHPKPLPPPQDTPAAMRGAGRRLVGTDGLSCIGCHQFNRQPALTLEALDLLTTPERLNEDWFHQFLLDPNKFNPGTRMPAFWPGGVSPLPALLNGDTARQHTAIWNYLADGPRAKFPEGLSRESLELVVGGEAVVYRGKLWEAGFRAIATGYPERVNAAFDAEETRLALLWRGRFLNVAPHWTVQGMGRIHPLGGDAVVFPHGPALALLANETSPWPTNSSRELGAKFRGYQLDSLKRPAMLYSFRGVDVEDFSTGSNANPNASLRRHLTFKGAAPEGLWFRLAAGRLAPAAPNEWRFEDTVSIRINQGGTGVLRGAGARRELIVPVRLPDGKSELEVDYVW